MSVNLILTDNARASCWLEVEALPPDTAKRLLGLSAPVNDGGLGENWVPVAEEMLSTVEWKRISIPVDTIQSVWEWGYTLPALPEQWGTLAALATDSDDVILTRVPYLSLRAVVLGMPHSPIVNFIKN